MPHYLDDEFRQLHEARWPTKPQCDHQTTPLPILNPHQHRCTNPATWAIHHPNNTTTNTCDTHLPTTLQPITRHTPNINIEPL